MAFTISHAVVAPILFKLLKGKVPLASIAIGAMMPDIAGQIIKNREWTHSYHGVFSIDLVFGCLGCILWYMLYRPCIYYWYNRQIGVHHYRLLDFLFYTLIGLMIGGITHVFWDSFTHDDQPILVSQAFLSQLIVLPFYNISMPLDRLLQYLSSLLTLPLIYFLFKPIQQAPLRNQSSPKQHVFFTVLLCCVLSGIIWSFINAKTFMQFYHHDVYFFIRSLFVEFSIGFFLLFTTISVLFRGKIR